MRVRPGLRVLQVIYQDPVTYPPTINAARLLAAAGAEVLCLGFRREFDESLPLPASARIQYLNEARAGPFPGLLGRLANVIDLRRGPRREAKRFRPDLVIAYDHGAAWGVLPLLGTGDWKTVLHLHDLLSTSVTRFGSSDGWMWARMTDAIGRFDCVVVPEPMRADYLRDRWRVAVPISVVANSPPRGRPSRNELLKSQIRARSGADPKLLAVAVGNMGRYLEAIRGLAAARAEWHLALVGCGHAASVAAMMGEAAALGIVHRLHVFPYTNYDTVRAWLPGCDVGLAFYPSTTSNVNWQTMGSASVKVQEYLAAGVPSIVCSRKAFAALTAETGALEVIESETPEAIAAALDRLVPGGELHAERARRAVEAHLSRFNYEAQIQPLLDAVGLGGHG